MMFCHILYTQQYIGLIVKRKAHQLLAEGNKIVTKKEEIALWWASCAKVTKALQP